MIKSSKHIEIVSSSKPYLSSMSKPSRLAIWSELSRWHDRVNITIIDTLQDLEALVQRKPDLVFLGMKFMPLHPELGLKDTERIWISDCLDEAEITYTGSARAANERDCDKTLAKKHVQAAGYNTAPFCVARQNRVLSEDDISLKYPLFIKPTDRGGGLGIDSQSVVHNFTQLHKKVTYIAEKLRSDSLIEQYLPGREFSVAILQDELTNRYNAIPVELIADTDQQGQRILGRATKSANTEHVIGITDTLLRTQISELAQNAFHALEARDYGRIDIRLDASGTAHFLEANLTPSLINGYGTFPKACKLGLGLDYKSILHRLVAIALSRNTANHPDSPELLGANKGLQPLSAFS